MLIVTLVILELILFFIALVENKQDILCPPVIICLFSFGSHFLALLNYNSWGLDIHFNTFAITLAAMITVVCAAFPANIMARSKTIHFRIFKNPQCNDSNFVYSKTLFWLLVIIQVFSIIWQIIWVLSIAGGAGSWSNIMYFFRSTNSTYSLDFIAKPRLLAMLKTTSQVISLLYGYIFSYNYAKTRLKDFKLYLPTILYIIMILLDAGRGAAVCIIIELIVLHYIMIQRSRGWSIKYSTKFVRRLLLFVIIMLIVFSYSRTLVGRMDQESTFAYISKYVGAEIKNFDLFLQENHAKSTIWGKETFSTIHNQLWDNLNIPEWNYIRHLEFRNYNGIDLGNVYGAIRSYYADFGICGVILLTFIFSFSMTYLYYRIRNLKPHNIPKFDYRVIIFSYLSYSLFVFPIFDDFYTKVINTGNIELLLYLFVFKKMIFDWKGISFKNRNNLKRMEMNSEFING